MLYIKNLEFPQTKMVLTKSLWILQSLAGKMTISRYLMNQDDMYETSPRSPALDRGLSLHKMIRLITHALAGESYMNFMGKQGRIMKGEGGLWGATVNRIL